jgi:hypothetical protein
VYTYSNIEVFWCSNFVKNAAEVKGEQPLSPPAGGETLLAQCFLRAEKGVRKATAFRGGTNKTVPPFSGLWKVKIQKRPSGTFLTKQICTARKSILGNSLVKNVPRKDSLSEGAFVWERVQS